MFDPFFWIVGGLLVVGAVIVGWLSSAERRMRRELARYPLATIADAGEGDQVRLRGRVRLDGPPLAAPLTGRACAAWHVLVQERHSSGRSSRWETVINEHEAADFYLEDDRAYVRGTDAKLFATPDGKANAGLLRAPPPRLVELMKERGLETEGLLFNKSIQAHEGIFSFDEEIVVAGKIFREDHRAHAPGRARVRVEPLFSDWILASDHVEH
jgi:hypothetical protein